MSHWLPGSKEIPPPAAGLSTDEYRAWLEREADQALKDGYLRMRYSTGKVRVELRLKKPTPRQMAIVRPQGWLFAGLGEEPPAQEASRG